MVETPPGSSCGVLSVAECERKCAELAGCEGVVVTTEAGASRHQCFRRADIVLSDCDKGPAYD
eukprot:gene11132-19571_t